MIIDLSSSRTIYCLDELTLIENTMLLIERIKPFPELYHMIQQIIHELICECVMIITMTIDVEINDINNLKL